MAIVPFQVVLNNMCELIVQEVGFGYSENVYQNALKLLLRKNKYDYQEEVITPIQFLESQIGFVRVDLLVNKSIIIELKAISKITEKEINQVQRYKKLTGIINFSLKNYSIENIL